MPKNGSTKDSRVLALEGVRGIAAVVVVIFHVLISFFPAVYYSPSMGAFAHNGFEKLIYSTPLYALVNGRFAVAIFFILSGFVLSIGYFTARTKKDANTRNANQALKRYWRLMIPAFTSVMLAWAILALGLNYNQQAYEITGSLRLHSSWNFDYSFLGAIYQGVIGVFYGQDWYNQPLWTMRWEFLGSLLVFALLWLFGKNRLRYVAYLIACLVFLHSYLLGFVIGVVIADLYANKKLPSIRVWQAAGLILFGLIFAGINSYSDSGMTAFFLGMFDWAFFWYFIGATLIIFAVLQAPSLNKILSGRMFVALGKNTFSLYLIHDILLLSLMSFVFIKVLPIMGYVGSFFVSLGVFIAALIPATILFTKYIDASAIRVSRLFSRIILRRLGVKKINSF